MLVRMFLSERLSKITVTLNNLFSYSAMSRGCAPVLPLLLSTGILLYLVLMVEAVPGPLDCRSVPLNSSSW
jgi:hypothetical protein